MEKGLGAEEERRNLMEIVRRDREATTPEQVRWAIDFYQRIGALEFAQAEARRLIAGAFSVIDRIPMEETHRELFREISRFMIDRNT
jgi:geranylgeranyl pyrophosphate synthase